MRVSAIDAMGYLPNPPRQQRATLSIRFDKHTVKDHETGQEFDLSPDQAWRKLSQLNGWSILA